MSERTERQAPGVWRRHAGQWARIGGALRPRPEDSRRLDQAIAGWAARSARPPRGLVLGATPEMARLAWPGGTELLAVDHAEEMLRSVWPGFDGPGPGTLLADWMDMGLPAGSRDVVVSDGCFSVLRLSVYPELVRSVRSVLAPGGVFAFRTFVRPEVGEAPEHVYAAALAGSIGSFHDLKLRLLMAVQPDSEQGVVTGEVWEHLATRGPDRDALAAATGWPREQIDTIDAYRGQDTLYTFPLLSEVRATLEVGGFVVHACTTEGYDLAERCPTLVVE